MAKMLLDTGGAGGVQGKTPVVSTPIQPTQATTSTDGYKYNTQATVMRQGDKGTDVQTLQAYLQRAGLYTGALDGSYGPQTAAAVIAYQKSKGLTADGIAGKNTLGSMGFTHYDRYNVAGDLKGSAATVGTPTKAVPLSDGGTASGAKATTPTATTQPIAQPSTTTVAPKATVGGGAGAGGIGTGVGTGTAGTGGVQQPTFKPVQPTYIEAPTRTWEELSYTSLNNPYIAELENMKFEYDPFQDEEYLRQAADYENQIAGMMIGRGGLYSSVQERAVQASLLQLRSDMTQQKYQEFRQDREFVLQMAKFISDEDGKLFSQFMTEQQFAFDIDKENWRRYEWATEFNFKQEQEAWSRYVWGVEFEYKKQQDAIAVSMQRASLELQRQAQAHREKMDALNYQLAKDKMAMDNALKDLGGNIGKAQDIVYSAARTSERDERLFKYYMDDYKKKGVADSYLSKYFGVPIGSPLSSGTVSNAILNKAQEIDNNKRGIEYRANMIGLDSSLFDEVSAWWDTLKGGATGTGSSSTTSGGYTRLVK